MLRRTFTFLLAIILVAAAGLLVYLNPEESSLRLTRAYNLKLPLGVLIVAASLAGGLLVFIASLFHEGRRALREWRARRRVAVSDRTVRLRTDGLALTVAGDHKRARTVLGKTVRTEEAEAADVIAYAETFSAEREEQAARRVLEKGLDDFGNDMSLLLALASVCRRTGDTASATTVLERALALHPASPVALVALRDVLFECENWRRGAEIQERLLGLRPTDERERNRFNGARFEAALAAPAAERSIFLEQILADSPDFVPAIRARAELLEAGGQTDHALRMLERGLKRRPGCELLETLARLSGQDRRRLERACHRLMSTSGYGVSIEASVQRLLAENNSGPVSNGTRPVAELPRCSDCGRLCEDWSPRCPGCGRWDSLERP